eukprot:5604526-Lingulodinium_polyedra.AAC.1
MAAMAVTTVVAATVLTVVAMVTTVMLVRRNAMVAMVETMTVRTWWYYHGHADVRVVVLSWAHCYEYLWHYH